MDVRGGYVQVFFSIFYCLENDIIQRTSKLHFDVWGKISFWIGNTFNWMWISSTFVTNSLSRQPPAIVLLALDIRTLLNNFRPTERYRKLWFHCIAIIRWNQFMCASQSAFVATIPDILNSAQFFDYPKVFIQTTFILISAKYYVVSRRWVQFLHSETSAIWN